MRLRVPGGQIPDGALRALSTASIAYADGDVHLTSRGNLQLRGIELDECGAVPAGLADAVAAAGLLPSASHERVRNIVASPLSGLAGGLADVRPLVREFDAALCADPALAELPGRFLFGIDDGRGDIASLRCDLTAVALGDGTARIIVGGLDGPTVPLAETPGMLLRLARRFVGIRGSVWHVRQLPRAGAELGGTVPVPRPPAPTMPYGVLGDAVSVLVPLGILTPATVAALPDRDVVVTPWRGLIFPSGSNLVALRGTGLETAPDSAWQRVTACTGAPGCSLAEGDTRALARRIVAGNTIDSRIHVVGCERACGAPHSSHRLVFARSTP
ncbi:cobalamin biosynthesis protein CobG [Rhodococcus rhodochrous]|uniref:cobalamin biosynthesis protein CobG n=1 Tax=Rhodococcus rhodochrous TaxID=1829 RepID=UPI001E31F541|nr:cobalamin biosynthesis protein CobG [Rhodococcus rhodochrous]MCD2099212.1 cobalamin biosynthesis protein CobG [Rhodococcus rhodochrous]MCD2120609.1 cobalamin biosynthesis protein CobG [Rhodococcus rhodochrous]MCQ4136103.1 cobalamin biosynthesis protein CobG [Rhodococcus rhodochrous]MDJ0017475.1 cobalamin biosynthesis protein CobG [Rhodococcus rhodochrous]